MKLTSILPKSVSRGVLTLLVIILIFLIAIVIVGAGCCSSVSEDSLPSNSDKSNAKRTSEFSAGSAGGEIEPYKTVPNPLHNISRRKIHSVTVEYETGEKIRITSKRELKEFYNKLSDVSFCDGWVTLNGEGYISEQYIYDNTDALLVHIAINTEEGEIVIFSDTGDEILGVGNSNELYLLIESCKQNNN